MIGPRIIIPHKDWQRHEDMISLRCPKCRRWNIINKIHGVTRYYDIGNVGNLAPAFQCLVDDSCKFSEWIKLENWSLNFSNSCVKQGID